MKRAELEKHLGNNVELTLLNGTVIQGELHKTGEKMFEHEANLYIPKKLLHLDKTTILYI